MDIQRDLQEFNRRTPSGSSRSASVLTWVESSKRKKHYFGSAVVIAARIMDESSGGQILVSDLLRQVADGPSNSEHEYSDFGRRTLKGSEEEEQIFEVLWQATA